MRKLLIALTVIFTLIGVLFTILPMGSMAVLPIGIALVLAVFTFLKSDENQKNIAKYLLIFTVFILVFVVGKVLIVQDKVEEDVVFETTKVESNNEAIEELNELDELEDLDGLEELDEL